MVTEYSCSHMTNHPQHTLAAARDSLLPAENDKDPALAMQAAGEAVTAGNEERAHYRWYSALLFFLIHIACFSAFFTPFHWRYVVWALALYAIRMFGLTAGYHRYFSHRSFKLNRVWQFLLAFLAETSCQKGVLWWAAHHRVHHLESDTVNDVHSPRQRGFWWAHIGWIVSSDYDEYEPRLIADFGRFPELRWLDHYYLVPPAVLGTGLFLFGGWPIFLWGFVISTVILFHGTFCINSLAHVWGTRRFNTPDDSRNNFLLAIITLGEGWHNNHHQNKHSCRQGLAWWEVDVTYYILRALAVFGIVRDIREARLPYEMRH